MAYYATWIRLRPGFLFQAPSSTTGAACMANFWLAPTTKPWAFGLGNFVSGNEYILDGHHGRTLNNR